MNTTAEIIILSVIAAITPGLIMLLNERRLRRISEARLGLARAATAADAVMLSGEVKAGQLCHDHLCQRIFESQHHTRFNVHWNPFARQPKEIREFQEALDKELECNEQMRGVLDIFVFNFSKAFRNSHPVKFVGFSLWVLLVCGGLNMLLIALRLAVFGGKGVLALVEGWREVKQRIAEWAVVCGSDNGGPRLKPC